jgi:hypothetical protein
MPDLRLLAAEITGDAVLAAGISRVDGSSATDSQRSGIAARGGSTVGSGAATGTATGTAGGSSATVITSSSALAGGGSAAPPQGLGLLTLEDLADTRVDIEDLVEDLSGREAAAAAQVASGGVASAA